jgi:hypothetical protein
MKPALPGQQGAIVVDPMRSRSHSGCPVLDTRRGGTGQPEHPRQRAPRVPAENTTIENARRERIEAVEEGANGSAMVDGCHQGI